MNTQKLEPVPGPWVAYGKIVKLDWGRDSVTVTRVDSRGKFVEGYDEANARLIAASPEMLAALEKLTALAANQLDQSATHDGLENCKALADARQAISKAKGGAE